MTVTVNASKHFRLICRFSFLFDGRPSFFGLNTLKTLPCVAIQSRALFLRIIQHFRELKLNLTEITSPRR